VGQELCSIGDGSGFKVKRGVTGAAYQWSGEELGRVMPASGCRYHPVVSNCNTLPHMTAPPHLQSQVVRSSQPAAAVAA
jgi:hypothetical protein